MAVWKASSAGAGFAGIALEQDFAAQEMREWEITTTFSLARERQRLVDARERAVGALRPELELGLQRLGEPTAALMPCSPKAAIARSSSAAPAARVVERNRAQLTYDSAAARQ